MAKNRQYSKNELLTLTNRDLDEALTELYDRYNYFYLTIDGKIDLPIYDGQTHQILKMIGEALFKHKALKGGE